MSQSVCFGSLSLEFVFGSEVFRDLMLIINVNAGLLLFKCFIQLKASVLGPLFSSPFPSVLFTVFSQRHLGILSSVWFSGG